MLKVAVLLLLFICGAVLSLICETCDGATCYDRDRWLQESCPPSTQFCYRLSSKGRAFRRGCADYPCGTLPGVQSGIECRHCSQDRCNNERDSFFHQRGGGVSWRNVSNRNGNLITSGLICLVVILFVDQYIS